MEPVLIFAVCLTATGAVASAVGVIGSCYLQRKKELHAVRTMEHESRMVELERTHAANMAEVERAHSYYVLQRRFDHEEKLAKQRREHEEKMAELVKQVTEN